MTPSKIQKDRPFAVHRALHLLLSHLAINQPELGKESFLLQEELDAAYAKQLEGQQAALREPKELEAQQAGLREPAGEIGPEPNPANSTNY